MFKNSSRSKSIGRGSSWSAKGPLKVALSRLPSGAYVYPLELSSTLGSFRIPSAALCRGSREGCHKESIVTKYNNKIWFHIYSKSLFKTENYKPNTLYNKKKNGHFSKKKVLKRNTIESPLKTRKFTSFWNIFSWPPTQHIS